ncbi:MAG: AMP-binding protein [Vicinamibacterales bacterium]
MPAPAVMPRDSLLDVFDELAARPGICVIHDDGLRARTRRYAEVARAAGAFAARLAAAGIGRGAAVLIACENRPEWIAAFWGVILTGAVVVPVEPGASPDLVARIARAVEARLVLVWSEERPGAGLVSAPVWTLRDLAWPDDTRAPLVPPRPALTRADVAEILYTSGATGDPKGVIVTHGNLLANLEPVEREIARYRPWLRLVGSLRILCLLPLSHMFGQALALLVPQALSGTTVFASARAPADVVTTIRRRGVHVLVAVPKTLELLRSHLSHAVAGAGDDRGPRTVWQAWWRYRALHRRLGPRFWSVVVGGAPLDPVLERFWSLRGFAVIQGYGLTEAAPIVTVSHPLDRTAGSVGRAMPGVEIRLADDGEILVRGGNVTPGYFHDPALTARALEGGWLHTGDLGAIGPDGRVFVHGRKKELIVTPEGQNVVPDDVERVLDRQPGVRESAAVGLPAAPGSPAERVHAVLVVEPGADPERIVAAANAALEPHQRVRRAHAWPEAALPRTAGTGKLRRLEIRAWAGAGAGAPVPGHVAADRLTAVLADVTGRTDLSPETPFDALGLSSLERIEILDRLEAEYQTRLDERAFTGARDVASLRALVEGPAPAEPAADTLTLPAWSRAWPARLVRRVMLPFVVLPLTRLMARIDVDGRQHLDGLDGPVIFAANHQSYLDAPVILSALPRAWRHRLAPAMAKEFFAAHFAAAGHTRAARWRSHLAYGLAALVFNGFPLPQRDAGARLALRYMGELADEGLSLLIFPEGLRTTHGEIAPFRPGVALVAARLGLPVVPVRLVGLDRVLHRTWRLPRPGPARVVFGAPLRLEGDDYDALAARLERAVTGLAAAA